MKQLDKPLISCHFTITRQLRGHLDGTAGGPLLELRAGHAGAGASSASL